MGYNFGVLFTLGILFDQTKDLDPQIAWSIIGGICVFWAIISLIMVVEPPDADKKEKATCGSLFEKLKKALKVCSSNHEIILGYLNWAFCFQDV